MLKLATTVKDKITGLTGALVFYERLGKNTCVYTFQPAGLDKKTGKPTKGILVTEDRIEGGIEVPEPDEFARAFAAFGSVVTDDISKFTGTISAVTLHTTGCTHCLHPLPCAV